jgi:hypothetical protein
MYAYTKTAALYTVRTPHGTFTASSREQAFRMAQVAERRAQIRRVA